MTNIMVLDYEGDFEQYRTSIHGYVSNVTTVKSSLELVERCQEDNYQAVIIDLDHPISQVEIIRQIKTMSPLTRVVVLGTLPSISDVVKAIKLGACNYLVKPYSANDLTQFLSSLHSEKPTDSVQPVKLQDDKTIIGQSGPIKKVFKLIERLAAVETSVLIRGESGTGKELVAQALHYSSDRCDGPFVAVNCGAIPENLIESELFGFERGTFTGADKKKIGKFQFASKGTIFLDEIGDVSPQMQVKLLRALQEKKVTPVGSNTEIPVDVRVVSATNKPLEKMIADGTFRADLYYRLNVMPILLPPLRERLDDLEELCLFMISKFNKLHNRKILNISPETLSLLQKYSWPGNVRELENVIEHAFIIESSETIHPEALPSHIQSSHAEIEPQNGHPPSLNGSAVPISEDLEQASKANGMDGIYGMDTKDLKYPQLKEEFEKEFIKTALKTYRGRINMTAEQTQMTKVTLLRKLEKYNINPRDFQH